MIRPAKTHLTVGAEAVDVWLKYSSEMRTVGPPDFHTEDSALDHTPISDCDWDDQIIRSPTSSDFAW
jgi:hypothetical protein